jgi:hypothetical protein
LTPNIHRVRIYGPWFTRTYRLGGNLVMSWLLDSESSLAMPGLPAEHYIYWNSRWHTFLVYISTSNSKTSNHARWRRDWTCILLGHIGLHPRWFGLVSTTLEQSFASPAAAWSSLFPNSRKYLQSSRSCSVLAGFQCLEVHIWLAQQGSDLIHNSSSCSPGDIVYARILSKRIVVVNSEEIAKDLFEGRSYIYSDKPQSIVYEPWVTPSNPKHLMLNLDTYCQLLCGLEHSNTAVRRQVSHTLCYVYGCLMFSRWRLHRRILHQPFREAAIPTYRDIILHSAHKMLFSFLQDPTNYSSHFQMSVARFIMRSC